MTERLGKYKQKELISIEMRLNPNDNTLFYFKFPPKFKLDFPRIIGDYNPDWGIARYRDTERTLTLELVRETKGGVELDLLRFPHEKRKIECAMKVFQALGVDYRVVSDETADWWESEGEDGGDGGVMYVKSDEFLWRN